jgi:DNA-binding transcriptional ArsR family regulator
MRSPQTTRVKFRKLDYSIYQGCWVALFKATCKEYPEYDFSTGQIRILCLIDGLSQLYKGVNKTGGYTLKQMYRMSGMRESRIKWTLAKLLNDGLISMEEERGKVRVIRRYKLTRLGKKIADEMGGDMERVHERIVDLLYSRKLLKH